MTAQPISPRPTKRELDAARARISKTYATPDLYIQSLMILQGYALSLGKPLMSAESVAALILATAIDWAEWDNALSSDDKARVNAIEAMATPGMKWLVIVAQNGGGTRIHQDPEGQHDTFRAAIDHAMCEENPDARIKARI